jgi:UDP-3-O-[3-hydroxymyristoyl] glucosamine N-acyltransferase
MNKFIIFYTGAASIEITNYMLEAKVASLNDYFYFFDQHSSKQIKKFYRKKFKNCFFLNKISDLKKTRIKDCVIATGNIELRKKAHILINKLKLKSQTIIHPKSYIASNSTISLGCIVAPFVSVAPFSKIGKNNFLNSYSSVGHHSKLGLANVLCPYSTINGGSSIGNYNYLGTGSVVSPKIKIKNNSKLSSGSVLKTNMKSFSFAHGNPAKINKIYRK